MKRSNVDDYNRGLDLLFQEMADREAAAQKEQARAVLRALGASEATIEESHASLVKLMRMQGKTEAEAHAWADELLRRGAELGLLDDGSRSEGFRLSPTTRSLALACAAKVARISYDSAGCTPSPGLHLGPELMS